MLDFIIILLAAGAATAALVALGAVNLVGGLVSACFAIVVAVAVFLPGLPQAVIDACWGSDLALGCAIHHTVELIESTLVADQPAVAGEGVAAVPPPAAASALNGS